MERTNRIWVHVNSDSDVTRAVLEAGRAASAQGFNEHLRLMVSTATSELARNILKYAGKGEIIIAPARNGQRTGVQVTAQDRGPGIEDVAQALADHFSSSGTLGLGLPGVKRMMDEFEIDSEPGRGTRVVIRKWR